MISILMPIYNGIEFIDESVSSIMQQTYTEWVLIIGVNGHPPNSEVFQKAVKYANEKIHVYERVKNEAEDRATKWRKERREIGGYALRLEKEQGTFKHCVRYLFPLFNFN